MAKPCSHMHAHAAFVHPFPGNQLINNTIYLLHKSPFSPTLISGRTVVFGQLGHHANTDLLVALAQSALFVLTIFSRITIAYLDIFVSSSRNTNVNHPRLCCSNMKPVAQNYEIPAARTFLRGKFQQQLRVRPTRPFHSECIRVLYSIYRLRFVTEPLLQQR